MSTRYKSGLEKEAVIRYLERDSEEWEEYRGADYASNAYKLLGDWVLEALFNRGDVVAVGIWTDNSDDRKHDFSGDPERIWTIGCQE